VTGGSRAGKEGSLTALILFLAFAVLVIWKMLFTDFTLDG
jgi:hypothetical protein